MALTTKKAQDLQKTKLDLRKQHQSMRTEFRRRNPQVNDLLSHHLLSGLKGLRSQKGIWIGYCATEFEADPRPAIDQLGGRWAFPKMQGKKLAFYLMDEKSTWVENSVGIFEPEPKTSQLMDIRQAEGILVPGIAFDVFGNRLGSGRAFYDRSLLAFPGYKVGVAYSVQLQTEELPVEDHDIRMDYIATDEKFWVAEGN